MSDLPEIIAEDIVNNKGARAFQQIKQNSGREGTHGTTDLRWNKARDEDNTDMWLIQGTGCFKKKLIQGSLSKPFVTDDATARKWGIVPAASKAKQIAKYRFKA
jgi:hypothetical protein